jgi:hypothetical protein
MHYARHKHAASLLPDGTVLISGGSDDARAMGGATASSEIYDPKTKLFSPTATMSQARFKITTAVADLNDGRVIVAGDGKYIEVFDAHSQRYATAQGSLGDKWMYAAVVVLKDGRALITGGYNEDMAVTNTAWLYRPV